ncbi:MAG: hypothetical protein ACI86C_001933 [Candidatus Latescibacterota bacterium]|jgi:hypothetical protein
MLKIKYLLPLLLAFAFTFTSCEEEEAAQEEEQVEVNETSIIPSSTAGRPNNYLGCVTISSRITTIEVWDHGQIDGDIVSIFANGTTLIDQIELDGPGNPISRDYDFGYNGFNYVTLFAHNLGDIPPNTCTVSINGSEFILEANLDANGAIDVIVGGYGVDCSDSSGSGGSSGGGGGGGGDPTPGKIKFWTQQDFGCGIITVTVTGGGSTTINGFFGGGPGDCDNTSGGGNFSNLAPGDYAFTASCSDRNWSGTVNVSDGGCTLFQLL